MAYSLAVNFKIWSKQEDRRKRIYELYLKNRSQGKKVTVNHFQAENILIRTIYDIIQRAENDSGYKKLGGSVREAVYFTFICYKCI